MSEARPYTVILLRRDVHDPMELARALASIRSTPVQDQVMDAKAAWGIVADDLPELEAKALASALREAGIECAVGPASALVSLPEVRVAKNIDDLPGDDPVLVSAAGLTVTSTSTVKETRGPSGAQKIASTAIMLGTGLPIRIGGKKRTVETTREEQSLVFMADLHHLDPPRRTRIIPSDFDFSCLGSRMLYQAQGNLKLLIGDLVADAPEVWVGHGARVLLEGAPIRTMGYSTEADLEREARWLLTLKAIQR